MANIQKVKFEMTINFETMPYESEAKRIERVKKMFSKNRFVVFGQSYQIEAEILPSIFSNQIEILPKFSQSRKNQIIRDIQQQQNNKEGFTQ